MHSIFKLLYLFLTQGDVVFDVNFGDGSYFLQMADLVGSSGSIVGFERSEAMFQALKAKPEVEKLWSMSLLIHSKASDWESILSVSDYSDPAPNSFPNTPSEVYYQLSKQCPKLVRVSSRYSDPFGDVHSILLSSLSIIEQCPSVFLLDLDPLEPVEPIVELFHTVHQNSQLYWCPKENNSSRHMLVLPESVRSNLDWRHSVLYSLEPLTVASVSVDGSGLFLTDEGNDHYRKYFTLDSEVILSSFVSEGLLSPSFLSDVSISPLAASPSVSASLVSGSILFDSHLSSSLLLRIANASCLVWSRAVYHSLMTGTDTTAQSSFQLSHLQSVYRNCTSFAGYRISYVEELLTERASFSYEGYAHSGGVGGGPVNGRAAALLDRVMSKEPFEFRFEEEVCAEPVWCSHTLNMQQRIRQWQFPDETAAATSATAGKMSPLSGRTCANSKFLLFEPPSEKSGIGSMLSTIAAAFRYAICLDRILVLLPLEQKDTTLKFRHAGCTGNVFECYFEPIYGCEGAFTAEDLYEAHVSEHGDGFEEYPRRDERILVLKNLPNQGKCSYCHSPWASESRFFDGWFYRADGYNQSDYYTLEMLHVDAFMTSIKQTWAAQFVRFLVGRPRRWFGELLRETVALSLVSPVGSTASVRSFASMHVRFGNKVVEVSPQPLTRYMAVLEGKLPHLRDVFLSTETQSVLSTLAKEYPEHRFHWLHYPRIEHFVFGVSTNSSDPAALDPEQSKTLFTQQHAVYVREFIMSFANLWVSVEAEGFVGSLSSNWCMMILQLERTRGDGGHDYLSVDGGSAFTTCW